MINDLIKALRQEQFDGAEYASDFAQRLDVHIQTAQSQIDECEALLQSQRNQLQDLLTLKAWLLDTARQRAQAIDTLIGGTPPAPAMRPVVTDEEPEAADAQHP